MTTDCKPENFLLNINGIPDTRIEQVCLAGTNCSVITCVTKTTTFALSPTGSLIATTIFTDSNNAVIPQPVSVVPCPPTVIALIPPLVIAPSPPIPTLRPVTGITLCLADSTPIAIFTFEPALCASSCQTSTGLVAVQGWMNLLTGIYSLGNPPAGTKACGEQRSIELGASLCDVVNGVTVGTATPEYTYGTNGSVTGVRLVGLNGAVYVPQGVMQTCAEESLAINPVHFCDTEAQTCREFLGWYSGNTGLLVRLTELNGVDAAPSIFINANLKQGRCLPPTTTSRIINRNYMIDDIFIDIEEVTSTDSCGYVTTRYFDTRTVPLQEILLSDIDIIASLQQNRFTQNCGDFHNTVTYNNRRDVERVTLENDVVFIKECPTTASAFGSTFTFPIGATVLGNGIIPVNGISITVYNATCAAINFVIAGFGNFVMPPYSTHNLQISDNIPSWTGAYNFVATQGVACGAFDSVDNAVYVNWTMKV